MFSNNLLMAAAGGGVELVEVGNSALFDSANTEYLDRAEATGTSTTKQYISAWVNFLGGGAYHVIMHTGSASTDWDQLIIQDDGKLAWQIYKSSSFTSNLVTSAVYRDYIGWMHIEMLLDHTLATANDRQIMKVNGVQVTDFASRTDPTQHSAFAAMGISGKGNYIGDRSYSSIPMNGYMAEVVRIDGDPAGIATGEFDGTGLYWTPKSSDDIKALTFGTNGFYLDNATTDKPEISASGTPISAASGSTIGDMTSGSGLAAIFDGVIRTTTGYANGTVAYAGKDWGSGVTKTLTGAVVYPSGASNWVGGSSPNVTITIQGSTDNFSASTVDLGSVGPFAEATYAQVTFQESDLTTTTAYRYHRVKIAQDGSANDISCSQIEFFENSEHVTTIFDNNNTVVTTTHTPTNSHCLLNPLIEVGDGHSHHIKNGNLTIYETSPAAVDSYVGTLPMAAGKYYWEITIDSASNAANLSSYIGIATSDDRVVSWPDGSTSTYPGQTAGSWAFFAWGAGANSGKKTTNAGAPASYYDTTISVGDVVGVAYDADNGAIWISINDSWIDGNGSDSSATVKAEIEAGTVTSAMYSSLSGTMYPVATTNGTIMQATCNFGTSSFTGSEPTNFTALNTTNIAEATTRTGADLGDAFTQVLATETNIVATLEAAHSYTNYLQIYKNRDSSESWYGQFSHDSSNAHTWSTTNTNTTFPSLSGSDAFLGMAINLGATGIKGGSNAHTNGADSTVTHNAGDANAVILLFSRGAGTEIYMYHPQLTAGKLLYWTGTDAETTDAAIKNVGANSFDIDTGEATGTYDYLVVSEACPYFFQTIYTGNNATDGTFAPLVSGEGIQISPRFIDTKDTAVQAHYTTNSVVDTYNPATQHFNIDTTSGELTAGDEKDLVMGLKQRLTGGASAGHNASGLFYTVWGFGVPQIDSNGRILAAR